MYYLTIMADHGNGPYAWLRHEDGGRGVGGAVADAVTGLSATYGRVPARLDQDFTKWVARFEATCNAPDFSWERFHQEGLSLARTLRRYLPADVVLLYEKPVEDPNHKVQERTIIPPSAI